jgi:geranylgeranyl diphosphate synthase type I
LASPVERRLSDFLAARVARAREVGGAAAAVAETVADLALRGGKRLRAQLVLAGARAAGEVAPSEPTIAAGAAVELLQAYLLIHDDWMDGDAVRRGGPTAHVEMARRWGAERGAAGAVLAGDLASAWARALLGDSGAPPDRLAAAWRVWTEMEEDVILGQSIDVADADAAPERIVALKTTSYTVRGPLRLGAVLAGGGDGLLAALDAYAAPIGEAFQFKDDLLGLVGDPARTGKPVGADLKNGKRTSVLVDALAADADGTLSRALRENDVAAALEAVRRTGAIERSESRIAALHACALTALSGAPLGPEARTELETIAKMLVDRVG